MITRNNRNITIDVAAVTVQALLYKGIWIYQLLSISGISHKISRELFKAIYKETKLNISRERDGSRYGFY
jgi:hypothetical protein